MHPVIAKRLISNGRLPARRSMAIKPQQKQQITENTNVCTFNPHTYTHKHTAIHNQLSLYP